jgi:transcription-repair coupling factor (superfamily II helicase)
VQCRRIAIALGFEKLILKDNVLRGYFINKPDSPYFESATFHQILAFIQKETNQARLKQTGKNFLIIVEPVKSMQEIYRFLNRVHQYSLSGKKALA